LGVAVREKEGFWTRDSPGQLPPVRRPEQRIEAIQLADEAIQNADPWAASPRSLTVPMSNMKWLQNRLVIKAKT
jgi:hypothetical protein